jgi:heterodisulfide reductase subunit B
VVEADDPENPRQMDQVLEAIGAEVVTWPYKTDCCGGSLTLTRTDLVLKLSRKLLEMAKTVEADVMVTFCPMCQANLDTRQEDIFRETGSRYDIPIVYVTELMALALGNPGVKGWLGKHMVAPEEKLGSRGLL